jgi:hypothetical protein
MTPFQLYALFGAPAVLLLWMLGVLWLTRRLDHWEERRRHGPAE